MISRETLPDGAPVGTDRIRERAPRKSMASAGFGSPGEDVTVRRIDLNEALIRHPQSTFVMRAAGDAMIGVGISNGDVLLVDRVLEAEHGHVVIATVDGELMCRRLHHRNGRTKLEAVGPEQGDIVPGDAAPLEVWGVVTTVIKSLVD
ncbi:MAG: translesion error-prone DNA polymerase V autoproteolytic subunit [Burkholderiales bacterium]